MRQGHLLLLRLARGTRGARPGVGCFLVAGSKATSASVKNYLCSSIVLIIFQLVKTPGKNNIVIDSLFKTKGKI